MKKVATIKLALLVNLVTEAGCGINAMLRDPMQVCSFVGDDPVAVPLFGVALTALSIATLVALLRQQQSDNSPSSSAAAVPVLMGLVFYHFGVVWLFALGEQEAKEVIDARFPANDFQKESMGGIAGSLAGAIFHLVEGAVTVVGLMAAILTSTTSDDDQTSRTKKND